MMERALGISHERRAGRVTLVAASFAGLIVLVVGLSAIDSLPVGVFYDDGMYVVLAKSIATGHGLRWLNVPGTPAATHFPPGYPMLLALVWTAIPSFPANVLAFKVLNAVLLAAAAVGVVVFAERRLGMNPAVACALALAGCLGIPMLTLSTLVLSEPLFLALLIPTLLLAERVSSEPRGLGELALLGVAAGALTLVRTHGVALIVAIAFVLIVKKAAELSIRSRARDAAIFVACAIATVLPWQLWVASHKGVVPVAMRGSYESYSGWLAAGFRAEGPALILKTIRGTTAATIGLFEGMLSPVAAPWAYSLSLGALVILVLIGARRMWRTSPVLAVFLAAYAAIVAVWPFAPARFVWGVWPLVLAVPALAVLELRDYAPRSLAVRSGRVILLAGAAALLVGYGRYNLHGYRGRWWSSVARAEAAAMRPTIAWARARTRPTDVIATSGEPAVYLYSGRQAVPAETFAVRDFFHPASAEQDADALRQILAAYPIAAVAVLADSLSAAAQRMASPGHPELLLRDRLANGLVYVPVRVSVTQPIAQE